MKTVILVPRRKDSGRRDRLWGFCRDWWEHYFPDLEIFEGHHNIGGFSRAEAVNDAARDAGNWELCLIIDSDVIMQGVLQVRQGLQIAADTGRMVYCHDWRYALNGAATDALLAGTLRLPEKPADDLLEPPYGSYGPTFSNCQAFRRDLFDEIGWLDERLYYWGVDDWALRIAPQTLRGANERVHGNVYHLFHPRSHETEEGNPNHDRNVQLGKRYMSMDGNVEGMRTLIKEWTDLRDSGWKAQRAVKSIEK
jgi:hypothetical protein